MGDCTHIPLLSSYSLDDVTALRAKPWHWHCLHTQKSAYLLYYLFRLNLIPNVVLDIG